MEFRYIFKACGFFGSQADIQCFHFLIEGFGISKNAVVGCIQFIVVHPSSATESTDMGKFI